MAMGRLFEKSWRYLFVIIFPVAFGLIAIADPVVRQVFGQQFAPSIAPLRVLLVSLIFGFLSFIPGALLNATNKQKTQTWLMALALMISVILNLILLPRLGITGAAVAATASNAVLCLTGLYFSGRQVFINFKNIFRYINQTLWPALAMGASVYYLAGKIHYLPTILIGGIIYLVLICFTGVINRENISIIISKLKASKDSKA